MSLKTISHIKKTFLQISDKTTEVHLPIQYLDTIITDNEQVLWHFQRAISKEMVMLSVTVIKMCCKIKHFKVKPCVEEADILSKPKWVSSMWFNDIKWCHRPWSTLVQVMACCLTASSHNLDQCGRRLSRYQFMKGVWQLHYQNYSHISQGPMS